jgi:pimeloyl-ACP methyl ester carboxylesterase
MRAQFQHDGRVTSYLDVVGAGPVAPPRTLVLLHAFPLAAAMWQPQLAAVPAGWRFLAPDLRGFGQSSPGDTSAPASIDDYAQDVIALLDDLGLDRVVVAGLSMGGYGAFALFRLAPGRVRGLVLADTRAEADGETARASRDAMLDTLADGGAAAVFERMRPGLLGATTRASRRELVERVQQLALAQPVDGIRRAIQRLKSRPDSTPLLARIACPTLIVVGGEDQITGVDDARRLRQQIPGAELAVVNQAGHLSNLEQPGRFNATLARFLVARF